MPFEAPGQEWEYQDFASTFPPNTTPWPAAAGLVTGLGAGAYPRLPAPSYRMIDMAVTPLVRRMRAQGWEPAEPTDAPSLWKAKRVDFRLQRRAPLMALLTLQGSEDVILLKVTVSFRRRRSSAVPGPGA